MKDECMNCENDIMLKYSDLYIEYEKVKNYNKILEKCLDTKDELCKVLREDNEQLRNELRIWKEGNNDR